LSIPKLSAYLEKFASSDVTTEIALDGVLDGVAFLHKPFSPDEVAAKVRQVLNEGP
jgi:DNA-binding response OmpR family regulator